MSLESIAVHQLYNRAEILELLEIWKMNRLVWDILFKILEHRMSRGEFTVIDATCSKTKDIKQYKEIADQYRYRIYIVDFTKIPLETCLLQNKMRPELKMGSQTKLLNIYARFATQQIPSGVTY